MTRQINIQKYITTLNNKTKIIIGIIFIFLLIALIYKPPTENIEQIYNTGENISFEIIGQGEVSAIGERGEVFDSSRIAVIGNIEDITSLPKELQDPQIKFIPSIIPQLQGINFEKNYAVLITRGKLADGRSFSISMIKQVSNAIQVIEKIEGSKNQNVQLTTYTQYVIVLIPKKDITSSPPITWEFYSESIPGKDNAPKQPGLLLDRFIYQ